MDWDSLGPFIFFLIWMAASIFKASKKKKPKRRPNTDDDTVVIGSPSEPSRPPVIIVKKQQQDQPAQSQQATLDYMMSKPKTDSVQDSQVYRETEPQITAADKLPDLETEAQQAVWQQMQNDYKDYLAQQRFAAEVKADSPDKALDYIQQTEISSEQAARLRISIEKQQIIQAVTYAQVLEQPKSLQYLKRFGVRRVLHRD